MENHPHIVLPDGSKMPFSKEKLEQSLLDVCIGAHKIDEIAKHISTSIKHEISSEIVFEKVFDMLKKEAKPYAAKYNLKRAFFDLGPTGYPFEQFIGAIFRQMGWNVEVGAFLKGKCVTHEVDVVAHKDGRTILIECKFHGSKGTKSDVKVPLYMHSRFNDIKSNWHQLPYQTKLIRSSIVTNTAFTAYAIDYAKCEDLSLISWKHPKKGALKDLIAIFKMYPITCSSILSKKEKFKLIEKGILLCKDLNKNPEILDKIGVNPKRGKDILEECNAIIK